MQDTPISRARYMQENRKMRFEEAYDGWTQGRLTQTEAAVLLGQCERSFRRHIERYEADGLDGLLDKRLSQISRRRASSVEVDHVVHLYKSGCDGWSVAHFHSKYKSELPGVGGVGGARSGFVALATDGRDSGGDKCQSLKLDGFALPAHKIGRQKTSCFKPFQLRKLCITPAPVCLK